MSLCKEDGSSTYCQYFKLKVPNLTLGRFHLAFFIIDSGDKLYCFVIPQSPSFKRRKRAFLQLLLPTLFSIGIYIFVTKSTEKHTVFLGQLLLTQNTTYQKTPDVRHLNTRSTVHSYADSFHTRNENVPAAGNPPDQGVSPTIREK